MIEGEKRRKRRILRMKYFHDGRALESRGEGIPSEMSDREGVPGAHIMVTQGEIQHSCKLSHHVASSGLPWSVNTHNTGGPEE